MKKSLILISFLLLVSTSCSTKKPQFKAGVKIVEIEKNEDFKMPKAILFVFKGDTHFVNNYLNLEQEIRKSFKKGLENNPTTFNIGFNYELEKHKPLQADLDNIPRQKHNPSSFETVCFINLSNMKGWDNHLIKQRKQHYNLNLLLSKSKTEKELLRATLDVFSYYTIATQNKNSSALIYKMIME